MNTPQLNTISDEDLRKLRSWMSASFYQTWDLDAEGGMVEVVEREFCYSSEASEEMTRYLNSVVKRLSDMPEVSEFLKTLTGDYDPLDDGMEPIEWLILLKQYLRGHKRIFKGIGVG